MFFRLESSLVSILQLNLLQDNEEGGEDYSNENVSCYLTKYTTLDDYFNH